VTGAGKGIGRAIGLRLAEEAATVYVNDREPSLVKSVCDHIILHGGIAIETVADVTKKKEVKRTLDSIICNHEKLDILVNNVGVAIRSSLNAHLEEDWDHLFQVNLKSVFYCTQGAIRIMRKHRYGRIINLSSMLAIHGGAFDICYSATKGAINSFTKSLAREVGSYGITVNSICPSLVDTDLSSKYLREAGPYGTKMKKIWDELRPIKRDLLPEDIANVAAFLGSEESAYVNGQILQLDGGMT